MNAAEIIELAGFDGVRLDFTAEGKLHYSGAPDQVAGWLPALRENKAAILDELHREHRREKVIALMGDGRKFAVLVDDASTDPVIATVAIQGLATFEMEIPRRFYDGLALPELIEETLSEPSQLPGNAIPSPDGHGSRLAHLSGRAA